MKNCESDFITGMEVMIWIIQYVAYNLYTEVMI